MESIENKDLFSDFLQKIKKINLYFFSFLFARKIKKIKKINLGVQQDGIHRK